jgi:hypothetical protein
MEQINTPSFPEYSAPAGGLPTPPDESGCPFPIEDTAQISGGAGKNEQRLRDLRQSLMTRQVSDTGGAPQDHVLEVTDASFDTLLAESPYPVFVDFYSPT